MNILYIHGLDSSPNPERIALLEQSGHQVSALHLDYRTEPATYQRLRETAVKDSTDFIVGSSLGGRLGYWLCEDLGIPGLLFNPAVAMEIPGLEIPVLSSLRCPQRYIVLGARDERVNPVDSLHWLRTKKRDDCAEFVCTCDWLPHEIDLPTFQMMARWAGL